MAYRANLPRDLRSLVPGEDITLPNGYTVTLNTYTRGGHDYVVTAPDGTVHQTRYASEVRRIVK